MTTKVRVTDDWMLDRVALLVSPSEGRVLHWQVTEADHGEGPECVDRDNPAVLSLPEGVARAIYEALDRHFGGGGGAAGIRKDYDAERARVDRFIDHLTRTP